MRTAAFILFALITAAAAVFSTLVASRQLSLEKEVTELHSQLDAMRLERDRQEAEKTVLRQEQGRIQADLEARLAEERSQLETCSNQQLRQFQEISASLLNLQKRLTDIQALTAPSVGASPREEPGAPAQPMSGVPGVSGPAAGTQNAPGGPKPAVGAPAPPPAKIDVPRGAFPTREQEADKLQKVN